MKRFLSAITMAILILGSGAGASADIIAFNDFDSSSNLISGAVSPDLSGNNGFFPTDNRFDIFGITNRSAAESRNSNDLLDDSTGSYAADSFGILKTAKTDNVFAVEDLNNSDNPSGTGTASWTFDITGATNLSIFIDFAAMGDFESSNDGFEFTASIDGGPTQTLFDISVDEAIDHLYTLESGNTNTLNDPLSLNGTVIDNDFSTFFSSILGTGNVLTLTFDARGDGGSEVFAFDNIRIDASPVPVPAAVWLLGSGLVGLIGVRRKNG